MAEILSRLPELQALPPDVHWFCESRDTAPSAEHIFTSASQDDRIPTKAETSLEYRHDLLLHCLQVFAFDADELADQISWLAQNLSRQLGKCHVCIVEYYKLKRALIAHLRDDYEEDDVDSFSRWTDELDIRRINQGLEVATRVLKDAPREQRGRKILDNSTVLSLFEVLSCTAFLANADLIRDRFVEPFKLLQSNTRLQVTQYVPGATIFLFHRDDELRTWALHTWRKFPRNLTKEEFDFAVRDQLLRNLEAASVPLTDMDFVHHLWCGVRLIVDKLDPEMITHSLRAIGNVDIFRLALEHLRYNTPLGLRYLLQTIEILLEKAPKDFWDSMGSISPTTFIEQVFNNPQYDYWVKDASPSESYETSALKDMLSWIQPFMASLQSSHQPQVCRFLSFQLMNRLQEMDTVQMYSKIECYHMGLGVLSWTLKSCNEENKVFDTVGRLAAAETLHLTGSYIARILAILTQVNMYEWRATLEEHCLRVIRTALALECKSLRADQEKLQLTKALPHGLDSYAAPKWDALILSLGRGHVALARAALMGTSDLVGLEKIGVKTGEEYSTGKIEFNRRLEQLAQLVRKMLEKINESDLDNLDKLFRAPETAISLVSSLLSPDSSTYEAGVNLIKSISGESARKEAIGYLLRLFFDTTLNSFSWSIRRVAQKRSFASCPRMLKTSTDILDMLCDSQTGLLRTRTLSSVSEIKALENFWERQWEVLKVIYEKTEEWSRQQDQSFMKEFCRDTMEFSERLFDQYSIFASAIESGMLIKSDSDMDRAAGTQSRKDLLKHPARTTEAIVKWLRLRDPYLAETSVNLVTRLLGRLTEWRMTLTEGPCSFLEHVALGDGSSKRTRLTPQHKAELLRALEENLGRPLSILDVDQDHSDSSRSFGNDHHLSVVNGIGNKSRVGTIDLEAWRSKAKVPREVIDITDVDEYGDSDIPDDEILAASRSVERLKRTELSSTLKVRTTDKGQSLVPSAFIKNNFKDKSFAQKQAQQASFREKREKEREAKRKRDAEALARVKKNIPIRGVAEQTLGEGSGLGNLGGVQGKDHAPKGSGMMVSSGSDTDSDNTLDDDLFGGSTKTSKVSDAVKDYQESKLRQAKAAGPTKKTRQIRSAKDMRARLAPDLSPLHRTILGWDFFHRGDFPPNSDRDDYSLVTSTFRTPTDYQNTFEPLLILEAWQGFLKSKEEGNYMNFEINVANRLTVDSFVEVSTTMAISSGKELGISEADIILMSKAKSPATDPDQPHCLARVFKITRKKASMDISYRVNVGNNLVSSMVPNATIYGVKISSITPLEREYGALLGLKYYDLCDEITRAKTSPLLKYSEKQLDPIVANYRLNLAQAKAVKSAIDNDAFTLVQGPPGSGKTKTIVAIVGALLTGTIGEKGLSGVPISRPSLSNHKMQSQPPSTTSKKLLVCAPSNAAVDELVMRFKQGVKTTKGESLKISVVRLGRSDAINTNVLDVTLEELVNAKLNLTSAKKPNAGEDIHSIMIDHKATHEELNAARARLDEAKSKGQPDDPEHQRNFELLKRKKEQLSKKIDLLRDSGNTAARNAEITRRHAQQEILDGAHVICATLSGSGHDMFQNLNIEFETVVIDEAAQSIELSALIPLKYGCAKCVMVGDPKQLPPTVLSREASRFQYEQSLFVRMQANHPDDVHLLDTQYRMHPEISLFPSKAFYEGRLLDGQDMAKLRAQPWHRSSTLGPYRFFDVKGTHQSAPKGHSLINVAELEVALQLYDRLKTDCRAYDFTGKIGIITPYKSQLRELRARFAQKYGESIFSIIEFNTTDAFQGRESEIIIFSCVRASVGQGIGFLSDIRRMNVGITRAKSSLWVLGNSQSLMQGEFWAKLIEDAKSRKRYTDGDVLGMLRKPLAESGKMLLNSEMMWDDPSVAMATNQDVDMADAPDVHEIGPSESRRSSFKRSPAEKSMKIGPPDAKSVNDGTSTSSIEGTTVQDYNPSGGRNGLNSNFSCGLCGSPSHFTNQCDNTEAISLARKGCVRCGEKSHTKSCCFAERCLDCGEFGHLSKTCTSRTSLPKRDKERLNRSEMEHHSMLSVVPDWIRKRQLGDHDKSVPNVQATRKTPPPGGEVPKLADIQVAQKRKRENSPPLKPPAAHNHQRRNSFSNKTLNTNRGHVNGANSARAERNSVSTEHKGIPGEPKNQSSRPKDASTGPSARSPLPDTRLPPRPPPQEGQRASEANSNSLSKVVPPPRPAPQNQVRPPKIRKKEANPFIIPNRRPHRS